MRPFAHYIIYLAALLSGCFFISACENDIKAVDAATQQRTTVEEALNITSYLSQAGQMKARLKAPFMLRYQTDSAYVEFPRSLHVDFYNDSTKIESVLDAMYGRFREYERKVFLKDSVVVINILKKDTLRTDELWWDQNQQQFYTDKPVRIHQPDKTIFGRGLKAAQDLSWYEIYHITGPVKINDDVLPE